MEYIQPKFNKEEALCFISMWSIDYDNPQIIILKDELSKMLLSFNLFEKIYFNFRKQEINHWWELFDKSGNSDKLFNSDELFDEEYEFFKNRYYRNGLFTKAFDTLYLNKETRDKVEQNFKSDKNKVYTLLAISYRFRNNIYHGNKDVRHLERFTKCYENINKFLSKFMHNVDEKIVLNNNI